MPVSQGSAGGLPGMNLKAWVMIEGNGTMVKGFNVASVARASIGSYTVTFSAPMGTVNYLVRASLLSPVGVRVAQMNACTGARSVGAATVLTFGGSAEADVGGLLEFYE